MEEKTGHHQKPRARNERSLSLERFYKELSRNELQLILIFQKAEEAERLERKTLLQRH